MKGRWGATRFRARHKLEKRWSGPDLSATSFSMTKIIKINETCFPKQLAAGLIPAPDTSFTFSVKCDF